MNVKDRTIHVTLVKSSPHTHIPHNFNNNNNNNNNNSSSSRSNDHPKM